MAAFLCEKAYYVPGQDLVALAGKMESGFVRPGLRVDLPMHLKGPGWVFILDVQVVPFADGRNRLCLILPYGALSTHQLMEFSDLEGVPLDIRP